MKSPEYITHGTSSERDALKIEKEGFKAEEGRATVSADLIYAYEWATNKEKREGSKSETETQDEEVGRMIIMRVPDDKVINYATHTNIEVDEDEKKITGYSSKYQSGRKQLAIYNEGDVIEKKQNIEQAKKELKEIIKEITDFLFEIGIDFTQLKNEEDFRIKLIEATKGFDIERKLGIYKKVEELQKQRIEKINESEPEAKIEKENILLSLVPTPEFGQKLNELKQKISNFENIDPNLSAEEISKVTVNLETFSEEITKIIKDNQENLIASGLDVKEIVGQLLETTFETEIINMVRSFSMDVKQAQGFDIYKREENRIKDNKIDKEQLKKKLERIQLLVNNKDFNLGMENLNRYLRINIDRLLNELND